MFLINVKLFKNYKDMSKFIEVREAVYDGKEYFSGGWMLINTDNIIALYPHRNNDDLDLCALEINEFPNHRVILVWQSYDYLKKCLE